MVIYEPIREYKSYELQKESSNFIELYKNVIAHTIKTEQMEIKSIPIEKTRFFKEVNNDIQSKKRINNV